MTQNQVFGYADRLHINPGQTINFHISSEGDEHFSASLDETLSIGASITTRIAERLLTS